MWELTTKLEQLPAWVFTPYLGELEAGRPPVSLVPERGSRGGRWGERLPLWPFQNAVLGLLPRACAESWNGRCHCTGKYPLPSTAWISLPKKFVSWLMWLFSLWFQKNDLLLQNKKLMWAQEKVQILVAIHASLPVIAEKAALLWAAGVPKRDAAVIMAATTSSSGEPGTSNGQITLPGPRIIRSPALQPCQITPDFLHPWLFQPTASQPVTGTQHPILRWRATPPMALVGSLVKFTPPSDFQDVSQNPHRG